MPVDERLRSALAAQAATVHADAEAPLERVRRRRTRSVTAWSVGVAAALVAIVTGVTASLTSEAERPAPATPPAERSGASQPAALLGTYVRTVTADQLAEAGFAHGEVRVLLGGEERGRLVLNLRVDTDDVGGRHGWVLQVVDRSGERHARDAGPWYVAEDAVLTMVSQWKGCLGCRGHYTWQLDRGRLRFDATRTTPERDVVQLLEQQPWSRRG